MQLVQMYMPYVSVNFYHLLQAATVLFAIVACHEYSTSAETEIINATISASSGNTLTNSNTAKNATVELPKPFLAAYSRKQQHARFAEDVHMPSRDQRSRRPTLMDIALQASAREGLKAMTELYDKIVPEIVRNGQLLDDNHPAALLSKFSAPVEDTESREMAAFATISATKAFRKNYKYFNELARQAHNQKISLRRTALEGLCPPRDPPQCMAASERYRTHDGSCNNKKRLRWGAAQMPFNRFLPPEYGDGVDSVRNSIEGGPLSSSRFVSLLVHGAKDGEAALTLMTAQWGQLLDHDMTSTAQPRSINGSVPSCCGGKDFHPSCFPIKVPLDDPWLAPLKVRCLEFLRSAPAQRRDCILSWREQTNQATSYIDASPIYSNSAKSSDNARVFRNGLLVFGRGDPAEDVCQRGAIATQCIRAGDGRSGEQPGLLALHHVWVGEHNRIALELGEMNPHWSDEKIYQETRRIIGAMFQHITYREFLPIILGREVCKLFDLDLMNSGYYEGYDAKVNPTVANSFAAAAFRFGHSLVQNSYMRCDRHHNVIRNNVSLHEEFQRGDIGSAGSLHRLIRGMATQRALKRDEFITPELTNHLFQTPGFPFGLDLAAINIQRGRDHGIPSYTAWRVPCGLTPITTWDDFANVVGPESAQRVSHAYRSVHDIDLFVGGIAERPVVGGLVGPTFSCILAQQFSNSRKGDRFWYENAGFKSSFTPAQLHSLRHVTLAQVLCRAVGGGTFQPHIFIPPELPGNERLPCGEDALAPIDLSPWLEQDPFNAPPQRPTFETQIPERIFEILPTNPSVQAFKENKAGFSNRIPLPVRTTAAPLAHVPHIDFIPNASTGFQRPANITKIHDKLDIKQKVTVSNRPASKPIISGVHNKIDKGPQVTLNIKSVNRRKTHISTTKRRTIVINNIPIELRSAASEASRTSNNTNTIQTKLKTLTTLKPEPKVTLTETENNLEPITHDENHGQKTSIFPKTAAKATLTATHKLESRTNDDDGLFTNTESNLLDVLSLAPPLNEPEEYVDTTTIAEEDIFDIFSKLTEPVTDTIATETNLQETDAEVTTIQTQLRVDQDFSSTTVTPTAKDNTIIVSDENKTNKISTDMTTGEQSNETTSISHINSQVRILTKEELKRVQRRDSEQQRIKDFELFRVGIQPPTKIKSYITNSTTISSVRRKTAQGITATKTHITKPTPKRGAELRQYQTLQPIYTRPQKVILNGPNTDQYEIEINIRQTNKGQSTRPSPSILNYTPDKQTAYKPYGHDRYTPPTYVDHYSSTIPPSPYGGYYHHSQTPTYTPVPSLSQTHRQTKPPTVIYLNEHDDRTTTKHPGILQNFITFATNGFSGNRKPISTAEQEKPTSSYETSISSISNAHINSPHSSSHVASSVPHYIERPQSYSPLPRPISSLSSLSSTSSLSQVGGIVGSSVVHASSIGQFGSITGAASANGVDSTFSFNIRHRPESPQTLISSKPDADGSSYGLIPPRKPTYTHTASPEYINLPVATPAPSDLYYEVPHRENANSPFSSSSHKRPQTQSLSSYYSRTQIGPEQKVAAGNDLASISDHIIDYDYLSRTLEPIANDTNTEDDEDKGVDDYEYVDDEYDENVGAGKKFDRDGYLRPEFMAETILKPTQTNETSENSTTYLDDNYVLPMLNISQPTQATGLPKLTDTSTIGTTMITTDFYNKTKKNNVTEYTDAIGKHFNNNILAEDYEDENTTEAFLLTKTAALTAITDNKKKGAKPFVNVAFAPINILTKPERPDNWVIFDTPKEKPQLPKLPQVPEVNIDSIPTAEIPMPIKDLSNVWLAKFITKDQGMTVTDTETETNSLTQVEHTTILPNLVNLETTEDLEAVVETSDKTITHETALIVN